MYNIGPNLTAISPLFIIFRINGLNTICLYYSAKVLTHKINLLEYKRVEIIKIVTLTSGYNTRRLNLTLYQSRLSSLPVLPHALSTSH